MLYQKYFQNTTQNANLIEICKSQGIKLTAKNDDFIHFIDTDIVFPNSTESNFGELYVGDTYVCKKKIELKSQDNEISSSFHFSERDLGPKVYLILISKNYCYLFVQRGLFTLNQVLISQCVNGDKQRAIYFLKLLSKLFTRLQKSQISHFDVKDDNIMYFSDYSFKFIDFGLSTKSSTGLKNLFNSRFYNKTDKNDFYAITILFLKIYHLYLSGVYEDITIENFQNFLAKLTEGEATTNSRLMTINSMIQIKISKAVKMYHSNPKKSLDKIVKLYDTIFNEFSELEKFVQQVKHDKVVNILNNI